MRKIKKIIKFSISYKLSKDNKFIFNNQNKIYNKIYQQINLINYQENWKNQENHENKKTLLNKINRIRIKIILLLEKVKLKILKQIITKLIMIQIILIIIKVKVLVIKIKVKVKAKIINKAL